MIAEYLTAGLKAVPPRKDSLDGKIHVSDVANGCNLAVRHNKLYKTKSPVPPELQMKWDLGFGCEDIWKERGEPQMLADGWKFIGIVDDEGFTSETGVVGHEDRLYERDGKRHLLEIKSTVEFHKGAYIPWLHDQKYAEEHSTHYFIQAAGYAVHHKADTASILVIHRGSGNYIEYPVDIKKYFAKYEERRLLMEKSIAAETDPEPVLPDWTINEKTGKSYLCKGCPVSSCKLNPAYKGAA